MASGKSKSEGGEVGMAVIRKRVFEVRVYGQRNSTKMSWTVGE